MRDIANNYLQYNAAIPDDFPDGAWLWSGYDSTVNVNKERQNTIYTQSAVLIEADPHLWEHLPP